MLLKNILIGFSFLASITINVSAANELPTPIQMSGIESDRKDNVSDVYSAIQSGLNTAREMQNESDTKRLVQDMSKRSDGIANEAMGKERDAVLRYLGIDPRNNGQLYVFVSTSMPLSLIQQYMAEASWSGAILVMRGVPKGMTLADFIRGNVQELIRGKAASTIQIDPRLFDLFDIQIVPSIVYAKQPPDELCMAGLFQPVEIPSLDGDLPLASEPGFHKCASAPEDSYWRLDGKVSLYWALTKFRDDGAPVSDRLSAIEKSPYTTRSQAQVEFAGKWELRDLPSTEQQAIQDAKSVATGVPQVLQ